MDTDRFNAMKGNFKVQPNDGGHRGPDPRDVEAAKEAAKDANPSWIQRLRLRLRRPR